MAFQYKENSFSLWKNDKKESDKDADYTGSGMIQGVEVWVNAWLNETKGGKKYLAGKIKPKDASKAAPVSQSNPIPASKTTVDDDIPF
jgi:hypothetical protein